MSNQKSKTSNFLIIAILCIIGFAISIRFIGVIGVVLLASAASFIFGYLVGKKNRDY